MILRTFDKKKKCEIVAGEIVDDVFVKKVDPKKHLMKMFNAYGIQEHVIQRLVATKVQDISIVEPSRVLTSKLSDWLSPNIKVMDYGSGKQRFLPVTKMIVV